ncbi:MAG: toprim domain-containing protein, partial [Gammaproteobacteria bacterium]|nr:toprim domain-containing protein [Gammaproteobacteria bacterium]
MLNREKVAENDVVVLCEAPLDVVSFFAAGVENVTCSFGVQGVTNELEEMLSLKKKVYVAFDNDEAGNEGAKKLHVKLQEKLPKVELVRVVFPAGMDANDVLVKSGREALRQLVPSDEVLEEAKALQNNANDEKELLPLAAHEQKPVEGELVQKGAELVQEEANEEASEAQKKNPLECEQPLFRDDIDFNEVKDEVRVEFAERQYRVRGMKRNLSYDVMKVNVLVQVKDRFHVDSMDLYAAKARQ